MSAPTRADVCAVAIAECFRGDGEVLANPIGTLPMIGGRLARLSFEPDLLMTDGEAMLVAADGATVEAWNPYRSMFDVAWGGRRHVMMGASQLDAFGNQNIAAIGDYGRPRAQLLGFRGAPGNTANHATSYWVPRHTRQVFVERVDAVTGVGWDRAGGLRFFDLRRVVTNLAVLDFGGAGHRMRLASLHPGVTVGDVVEATGFELEIADPVGESRLPTDEELRLLRDVLDPEARREKEVPDG